MAATAKEINPRKVYAFAVECEGIETAYVQKVKIPKFDVKSAEHGDGPFKIKTASRVEFGQIELDVLLPAADSSGWWKDWLALVVNLETGALGTPDAYKKNLYIIEYGPDGTTIVEKTQIIGAYPAEIDPYDMDKLGEGNAVNKIKLNVDRVYLNADSGGTASLAGALGR